MTAPKIDSYRFGHIVIDGQHHSADVIILPDRVIGGWWRLEGHALHSEDLQPVFEAAPDLLIVGQGASGRMRVTSATRRALKAANIQLLALSTDTACQCYNEMRAERVAAAALHLTC